MKIALICRLRTRSTFLLESLCTHFGIQNLNERYFDIDSKYLGGMEHSLKLNNKKAYEINWINYQSAFRSITDYNFTNNFGIKIFTKMLYSSPRTITEKDFDNLKVICDLSDVARIKDYDQIFYLTRDMHSSINSQIYSLEIKNAIYRKNNINKIKYKSFIANEGYLPYIDSYIVDIVLQEKILEFLVKENIPHTVLDYQDIPKYVSENLQSNIPNPTIDTKFDYKMLIKNINQIEDYSNQSYEKISKRLSHIQFT